ncbi:thiopurine S-methyltransferase [Pseudaestuariivita atlantica]|uniref:Thiopurine S-methyltransferase n=1 Tax=Pseudaestuariivita atlantica TaxID=1317121 RepID=A0A0L1JQW4_9RHOB|nr:thiopurine S-methyltransferase [Pseudaestuariivita atlantica]KNG94102.1 thiopurine S-methyltransferase [Pseudaestuariivita atlantica]
MTEKAKRTNDPTQWHDRWRDGRIGFHQPEGNPLLRRHLPALGLPRGARLFLPLCGKTGDIGWLMSQGFAVAGSELSRIAVDALFDDLGMEPEVADHGPLTRMSGPGVDIWVGDMFDLTPALLGPVDAVYDRAALVALPDDIRAVYAPHLAAITANAPHLLITFDYDASTVSGPPFPVWQDEISALYVETHDVALLEDAEAKGGIKGVTPAREQVWHLIPR